MSLVSAGSCPHLGLNLISTLRPSEAPVNVLESRIWQHGLSFKHTRSLPGLMFIMKISGTTFTSDIFGGLSPMLWYVYLSFEISMFSINTDKMTLDQDYVTAPLSFFCVCCCLLWNVGLLLFLANLKAPSGQPGGVWISHGLDPVTNRQPREGLRNPPTDSL